MSKKFTKSFLALLLAFLMLTSNVMAAKKPKVSDPLDLNPLKLEQLEKSDKKIPLKTQMYFDKKKTYDWIESSLILINNFTLDNVYARNKLVKVNDNLYKEVYRDAPFKLNFEWSPENLEAISYRYANNLYSLIFGEVANFDDTYKKVKVKSTYNPKTKLYTPVFEVSYTKDELDTERKVNDHVRKWVNQNIKKNMQDRQRAKVIFDYFVRSKFQYKKGAGTEASKVSSVIWQKTGQCVSFSNYFQKLAIASGLNCFTEQGYLGEVDKESGHAWNLMKINGKMYCIDVTNFDNYSSPYELFLRTPKAFEKLGYIKG